MTAPDIRAGAVFLEALGDEAERLHPEIRNQLEAPRSTTRLDGVFRVAGSPFRRLTTLARPVVGSGLLVTRYQREVPFSVEMHSSRAADGRAVLRTTREFRFASRTERIVDLLTTTRRAGVVHNVMGDRGRVQLLEECSVGPNGELCMRTRAVALRVLGRRIALRGILGIRVDLTDGWDDSRARRTISMRAVNPLAGTVLRYEGWYRPVDQNE